ncbi:unnamed protein product [Aphanomyces euteiches]
MEASLSLSRVEFPSHNDSFRVEVALIKKDVPMRIWIESKESKAQWECVVKDFKEHLGKGVTHHLPSNVILTSLQDGLSSMDHDVEEEMEVDGCDVDLTESQDGHLNLELNLKAFRSLEVKYDFDMKPMKIEKVDILEAKIRDLEEDKIPAFLFVSLTEAVNQDEDIVWDEESSSNEDFFELLEDMTEVTISQPGFYQIQMSGHSCGCSQHAESVSLLVDDVITATASAGRSRVVNIHHLLFVVETTKIKFECCGKYGLEGGSTLKVLLVQEMPND